MIKKLSLLMAASVMALGVVSAEEAGHGHSVSHSHHHHDHHHHHHTCSDDEWTWSSVWCPGSSWTSTKVRRVCCKTTSCPVPTSHNTTITTGSSVPASGCQTVTATLWDLVADTLIICNKYTTECPASFANKATITFSVKAQGEESANAAPGTNTNGMLIGAGLAIAGLVAMFL